MKYAKAVVAIIVSAVGALITAVGPGGSLSDLNTNHWLVVIATVLGSGGLTWLVANIPGVLGGAAKAIVGFLSAGVASLVVATQAGGITTYELLVAFSAALVAGAGVYQVKNKGTISGRTG